MLDVEEFLVIHACKKWKIFLIHLSIHYAWFYAWLISGPFNSVFLTRNFEMYRYRCSATDWLLVYLCYWSSHLHYTESYTLCEHPVLEFHFRALLGWEMDSKVFFIIAVFGWYLCNIWLFFPCSIFNDVMFCQKLWWLINNNLMKTLGIKSCSILGKRLRVPEKVVKNCCQYSCCAGRNSTGATAQMHCVFLVRYLYWFWCSFILRIDSLNFVIDM